MESSEAVDGTEAAPRRAARADRTRRRRRPVARVVRTPPAPGRARPYAARGGTGCTWPRPAPADQAASGRRYCFQVAGMVGEASWMNTFGLGIRGLTRGCMLIWWGSRSPLRRLHGAHEATMFSQSDPPPLDRGITWSTVRLVRAPQYWHSQPSRAKTARRVILRLWESRGIRT